MWTEFVVTVSKTVTNFMMSLKLRPQYLRVDVWISDEDETSTHPSPAFIVVFTSLNVRNTQEAIVMHFILFGLREGKGTRQCQRKVHPTHQGIS